MMLNNTLAATHITSDPRPCPASDGAAPGSDRAVIRVTHDIEILLPHVVFWAVSGS